MTLEKRRKLLASKFILKRMRYKGDPTLKNIEGIIPFTGFWNRRKKPAFLVAYEGMRPKTRLLERSEKLPIYNLDIRGHIKNHDIILAPIEKGRVDTSIQFHSFCEKYIKSPFYSIYTDASKHIASQTVGAGIYSVDLSASIRLPDDWSVYTAEMFAIGYALEWSLKKNLKNVVVFSDSKSAIQKLKNWKIQTDMSAMEVRVKTLLLRAEELGRGIKCVWIPSHSGIYGNEEADKLANKGRERNITQYEGGYQDIYSTTRREVTKEWYIEWKEMGKNRGSTYMNMINEKKSFGKYKLIGTDLSRAILTTMMRLRSGHVLSPEHLFKINISENENCPCGELGDIRHLFFECSLNVENCSLLYSKLEAFSFHRPISLYEVIFDSSPDVAKIIFEFLRASNLKL